MAEDMLIFAAGFVDVVDYPKIERELIMNVEQVRQALPISHPLPLTLEHLPVAEVGWTLDLFQVSKGLFSVSVISSKTFIHLLTKLFDKSQTAHIDHPALPTDPILDMLHTWFPALSLSSLHPGHNTQAVVTNLFQHVSLCALGRRRGTISIYGYELPWVISKFDSLTPQEKSNIIEKGKHYNLLQLPEPKFQVDLETLMAKAIDSGFIRDRLSLLRMDKGVAAIQPETYLKASTTPHKAFSSTDLNLSNMQTTGATTTPTEELISVPKTTFMTLLQNNIQQNQPLQSASCQQHAFAPNTQYTFPYMSCLPGQGQPHGTTLMPIQSGISQHHPYPNHPPLPVFYSPGYNFPPVSSSADLYSMAYGYMPNSQVFRPGKRKRDDDELVLFPGETANLYRDLMSLSKNVSELQTEIKDLKQGAVSSANHPPVSFQPKQQLPVMYNPYNPNIFYQQPNFQPLVPTIPPTTSMSSAPQPAPQPITHTPVSSDVLETKPDGCQPTENVEASLKPESITQLQKMFCDELIK